MPRLSPCTSAWNTPCPARCHEQGSHDQRVPAPLAGGRAGRRGEPPWPPRHPQAHPHALRRPRVLHRSPARAEYLPEHQAIALADGRSVGAFFELQPAATDGQSPEYLAGLCGRLQDLITDAVPEEDPCPWVLQLFVQDEPSLKAVVAGLRAETDPARLTTSFTRHYFETLEAHLNRVGAPGGLFEDRITGGIGAGAAAGCAP